MKARWRKFSNNYFTPTYKFTIFQRDSEDGQSNTIRFEGEEHPERHDKLRRRDTPHYLKDKRINLQGDEEKVKEILAKGPVDGSENEQEGSDNEGK